MEPELADFGFIGFDQQHKSTVEEDKMNSSQYEVPSLVETTHFESREIELNFDNSHLSNYFSEETLRMLETNLNKGNFVEVSNYLNMSNYNTEIKDEILLQMMLSIHLFCLIKLKKSESIKTVIMTSNVKSTKYKLFAYEFLLSKANTSVSKYNKYNFRYQSSLNA